MRMDLHPKQLIAILMGYWLQSHKSTHKCAHCGLVYVFLLEPGIDEVCMRHNTEKTFQKEQILPSSSKVKASASLMILGSKLPESFFILKTVNEILSVLSVDGLKHADEAC